MVEDNSDALCRYSAVNRKPTYVNLSRLSRGYLEYCRCMQPSKRIVEIFVGATSGQSLRIAFHFFFEDREGSVWLLTNGQGLYRIRKQPSPYYRRKRACLIGTSIQFTRTEPAPFGSAAGGGLVRLSGGKLKVFCAAEGLLSKRIYSISGTAVGAVGGDSCRLAKDAQRPL